MKKKLLLVLLSAIGYWVIKNYVPYGIYALYPINLFVTFLHEFGHSLFALITGGRVEALQVNSDGSGYAMVAGGFTPLVLLGGYVGSALFGNLLLHIGLYKEKTATASLYVLMAILIFSAIWWFNSIFTSVLLLLIAALLFWLRKKSNTHISYLLLIIGTASIVYIVEDYNVGPSSDLSKFTRMVPILPQAAWAIIWLLLVLWITWINLRKAFK